MDSKELNFAKNFALVAHGNQKRKYTGEMYISHPFNVSEIVKKYNGSDEQIIAALLHDVVEDTHVTIKNIKSIFGNVISELVSDLTAVSVPSDGNRKKRKYIDFIHTSLASDEAKFIKLADLMDNMKNIINQNKSFAKVYLKEKSMLMTVLRTKKNKDLWFDVNRQLNKLKLELDTIS